MEALARYMAVQRVAQDMADKWTGGKEQSLWLLAAPTPTLMPLFLLTLLAYKLLLSRSTLSTLSSRSSCSKGCLWLWECGLCLCFVCLFFFSVFFQRWQKKRKDSQNS